MIRHIFVWRVAANQDREQVIEILNTLPARVSGIRGWEIGRQQQTDTGESGDPWDGVLVAEFDSWKDLESYSEDPYHVEVVEKLLPMFAARAVVDYERGDR